MGEFSVPRHVAIIMDGNGRWAKRRGLPRTMGHRAGCETVEQTVRDAADLGIEYLTVYGFSTENWKRSSEEVGALMQLFRFYIRKLLKVAKEKNVRVLSIGDRTRFDKDLIEGLNRLERETKDNTRMTFILALNYGGRDEIIHAVKAYTADVAAGKADPEELTEDVFSGYLYSAGVPDPELIIRPSGEMRVSNFLLWQSAYSEYVIMNVLWPDFTPEHLDSAIEEFHRRSRRFGGT